MSSISPENGMGGERLKYRVEVRDLLGSGVDREVLSLEVEQSDGTIVALVHPFADINEAPDESQRQAFNLDQAEPSQVFKGVGKLLQGGKEAPLLILEEDRFMRDTRSYLGNKQSESPLTVYTVSTEYSSPKPTGEGDSWRDLTDILTSVGVRRIMVGGAYFSKTSTQAPSCVRMFADEMKQRGFNVEITNLTYPDRGDVELV